MYVFATRGHIFKTTKAKLDDAMKEDVHGRGNEWIVFICTFHSYFKMENTENLSTELALSNNIMTELSLAWV